MDAKLTLERRSFLSLLGSVAMASGLVAAYGTLAAIMARFLFPASTKPTGWMFVTTTARLAPGGSLVYRTPAGATVNIARQGRGATVEDFVALSSTCPHLGCQVHWEPQNDRFFCPCHNGVFDAQGNAVSGPPAEAGQSLPRYPLHVAGPLLYIEVPLEQVAMGPGRVIVTAGPPGPGHDPCPYVRGGDTADV
jgi:Rieske Fe-S protein